MLYGIFMSVLTCLSWGSTSLLLRGIRGLDAASMSLMRAAGGFLCGTALFTLFGGGTADFEFRYVFFFIGLVLCNNVIGDVFLFFALHRLGVARGAAIASSYPIVVAVASHFLFGSPFTLSVAGGTILVITGTALLCRREQGGGPLSPAGLAYAFAASLFWAAGLLFNKELVVLGLPPSVVTMGRGITFLSVAFLIWIVRAGFVKGIKCAWRGLLTRESLMAVTAGASSLGAGAWCYSTALEYVPPAVATTIGAANPIAASLFAVAIYGEKPRAPQWAGIVLAVAGSVLVTF